MLDLTEPPPTSSTPHSRLQVALLLLALLAGAGVSVQVFLNGRLGQQLGSTEIVAALNSGIALGAVLGIGWLTGATRRARITLRAHNSLRPWHLFAGFNGAVFLISSTAVAPKVGLALLTVALVCGQTVGGLLVDHLGFGPAGRKAITAPRVLGVVLAVAAVSIGALGASGDLHLPLLAIIVGVGVLVACQQAAIGHVARATGEPVVAGIANFGAGLIGTAAIALLATSGIPPDGWSSTPAYWFGGLLGVLAAVVTGKVVQAIGVLRFVLAFIAGQAIGALAIDAIAPADGKSVTVIVVLSVLLTLAAVVSSEVLGRRSTTAVLAAP